MDPADHIAALQIGNRAGNAQDAMIAACGQVLTFRGFEQKGLARPVRLGDMIELVGFQMGVQRAAFGLGGSRRGDPGGGFCASFRRGWQGEISGGNRRDGYLQIDPVDQGA